MIEDAAPNPLHARPVGRGGLGTVRAPPEARLQAAAGDTVWALEFGDFDEPWVVAYRLTDG